MVKHLYIHIPFCESICSYCDFCRFVSNVQTKKKYIEKVVMQIKSKFDVHNKLDSIYIGGGTPNSLSQDLLHTLLCECKKFCKKNTEFTIECNPEFVNDKQIKVFKKYKINRVSLGVQSTNNALLKRINRKHTYEDVVNAVKLLQKNKIKNISCDFIYGFNETTKKELDDALAFISKYSIPHYSFYSLETKPNSLITKQGYSINIEKQEKDLQYIEKKSKYTRYEVSNWCKNKKYESVHNKAYWLTKEWCGIGLSACGFENHTMYENVGDLNNWKKKSSKKLSTRDYYFQILMMGLRLVNGIDLKDKNVLNAFNYYKNKLKHYHIKNNHLVANNVNTLNECLVDCL